MKAPYVDPGFVSLKAGKGSAGRGSGPGGEYWSVMVDGKRAGAIFINVIDEPPVGRHASVQLFLNAASQGRGIGRVAYRLASEASAHPVVYAHMRKSNHASRKAAEAAGFVEEQLPGERQLTMVRKRGSPAAEPSRAAAAEPTSAGAPSPAATLPDDAKLG
jgi:hypothetical protein